MKAAFRNQMRVIATRPLSPAEIAERESACAACGWNIEQLCQHPACAVCPGKQRRSGALQAMIADRAARCPAKLWT